MWIRLRFGLSPDRRGQLLAAPEDGTSAGYQGVETGGTFGTARRHPPGFRRPK